MTFKKWLIEGFRKVQANVGDIVIWNSKQGPVEAEFRGQQNGMDGWDATIIVRDGTPFQITVNADEIQVKQ